MRATKMWNNRLAIMKHLKDGWVARNGNDGTWRWINRVPGLPSLANPIVAPLISGGLLTVVDQRLALTQSGEIRLNMEQQ